MTKIKSVSMMAVLSATVLYAGVSQAIVLGPSDNCVIAASIGASCTYCAAGDTEKNVAATDRVVNELAQGELKEAQQFNQLVSSIAKMPQGQRMGAYLAMAGIKTDEQIAEFVGQREEAVNQDHIRALASNAGLTQAQSVLVLNKISGAILGARK